MKSKYIKILLAVMVFLWMGVIFNFSRQSGIQSNGLSNQVLKIILNMLNYNVDYKTYDLLKFITRKLAHATEYAILAIFLFSMCCLYIKNYKVLSLLSFTISAFYSLTDELHQIFVPGRTPHIRDCLIDSTGALLGILLCLIVVYTIEKQRARRV